MAASIPGVPPGGAVNKGELSLLPLLRVSWALQEMEMELRSCLDPIPAVTQGSATQPWPLPSASQWRPGPCQNQQVPATAV